MIKTGGKKEMLYSIKYMKDREVGHRCLYPLVFTVILLVSMTASICWAENVNLAVAPPEISISAFYNGTSIKATGTIPANSDVVLCITGPGEVVHLKKKGKVAGLLWMNTGKITLKNVPAVFMVYTTPAVAKMINLPTINLGYWSVKDQVKLEPVSASKEFLFKEFIKLKEEEGIYTIDKESIKYSEEPGGLRHFEINVKVPPKMKPGVYTVEASAISNDSVLGRAKTNLTLKLVGFPAWIAGLAFGHELLYGCMAVLVAIAAGLVMGVLFKDKGGAH